MGGCGTSGLAIRSRVCQCPRDLLMHFNDLHRIDPSTPPRCADAARRAPGPLHRAPGWKERQDKVHDRERDADAHHAGRHQDSHPGLHPEHPRGAGRAVRAHPRVAGGQGGHPAAHRLGSTQQRLLRNQAPFLRTFHAVPLSLCKSFILDAKDGGPLPATRGPPARAGPRTCPGPAPDALDGIRVIYK